MKFTINNKTFINETSSVVYNNGKVLTILINKISTELYQALNSAKENNLQIEIQDRVIKSTVEVQALLQHLVALAPDQMLLKVKRFA